MTRAARGRAIGAAWLRAWAVPLLALLLLEAWARTAGRGSDTLAAPSAALRALAGALLDGSILQATAFTFAAAAAGLAVGGGLGLLLGLLLGLSQRAAKAAFLSVEVFRPIPSVALIPIAMLVFGFGLRMELSIVAFACFWPVLILTQAAVRQVEPRLLEVGRVLGFGRAAQVRHFVLPAMVPRLFVALRLAAAIALVVAVTVEIAANPHGLGYGLTIAQQNLRPELMLAWLAWVGVLGYGLNAALLALDARVARRMGAAPPPAPASAPEPGAGRGRGSGEAS